MAKESMQTIPAIYVIHDTSDKAAREDIVYGVCKFQMKNTLLTFLSLPSQPCVDVLIEIGEVTEISMKSVVVSQIHLIRRASAPLNDNESANEQQYSMTRSVNSQSSEQKSPAQIKQYEKNIFLQFDSNVLQVLRELSGQVDENAIKLYTADGIEHLIISSVRNIHIIEHFLLQSMPVHPNIRPQEKRGAKKKTTAKSQKHGKQEITVLDYEMSNNEIIFPIKEFSAVDCITLAKSTTKQSRRIASHYNCIAAATERLIKQVYNITEQGYRKIESFFQEDPTVIISLEQLMYMMQIFPYDLYQDFLAILIVYSFKNDGRLLQIMLQQTPIQHIMATGIIANLGHSSKQQRYVQYLQCLKKFCLLNVQTTSYVLGFLFTSFPREIGIYKVNQLYFYAVVGSAMQHMKTFCNVIVTRLKEELVIQVDGIVFLRLENDLRALLSSYYDDGAPLFIGQSLPGFYRAEITWIEMWRFLYY